VHGEHIKATLSDTIHAPDATDHLISIPRLTDAGHNVRFVKTTAEIVSPTGRIIAIADKVGHLYEVRVVASQDSAYVSNTVATSSTKRSWNDWH
ncbi:hypothetical protein K488DRAFT_25783, partial [Vararia minispora EC-137]